MAGAKLTSTLMRLFRPCPESLQITPEAISPRVEILQTQLDALLARYTQLESERRDLVHALVGLDTATGNLLDAVPEDKVILLLMRELRDLRAVRSEIWEQNATAAHVLKDHFAARMSHS